MNAFILTLFSGTIHRVLLKGLDSFINMPHEYMNAVRIVAFRDAIQANNSTDRLAINMPQIMKYTWKSTRLQVMRNRPEQQGKWGY